MANSNIVKITEDYIHRRDNNCSVLRYPTKKKKDELMKAHGDNWHLSFLEPETRARLGK